MDQGRPHTQTGPGVSPKQAVRLALADGAGWLVAAGDERARALISGLSAAMQLKPVNSASGLGTQAPVRRLFVHTSQWPSSQADEGLDQACAARSVPQAVPWVELASQGRDTSICIWSPPGSPDIFALQLISLSLFFAGQAEARGGVLLHGALAEHQGRGILLVGRGGAGKTTASNRLQPPWRSLSDDIALAVRDTQGNYVAHPWPTWSRYLSSDAGAGWQVERAVPLRGLCFLTQSKADRIASVGPGQAVVGLVQSSENAWWGLPPSPHREQMQAHRLQRFENICALVQAVPAYQLHLSLHGPFWRKIEQMLDGGASA